MQPVLSAALQGIQQDAGGVVAELAREQRALDGQQVAGPAVGGAAALAVQVRRPHEALPRHPARGKAAARQKRQIWTVLSTLSTIVLATMFCKRLASCIRVGLGSTFHCTNMICPTLAQKMLLLEADMQQDGTPFTVMELGEGWHDRSGPGMHCATSEEEVESSPDGAGAVAKSRLLQRLQAEVRVPAQVVEPGPWREQPVNRRTVPGWVAGKAPLQAGQR